jgi:CRP-like cAMP-binding protein
MTDFIAIHHLSRREPLAAQFFQAAKPRYLKAGERLFAVRDAGDGCYLLDQGLLKVTVASPRGASGSSPFLVQAQSSANFP